MGLQVCPFCGHQNPDTLMICSGCKRDIESAVRAIQRGETVAAPLPPATTRGACVVVKDIQIPFWSLVGFMVQFAIASIPAFIILAILGFILTAVIAGLGVTLLR